MSIVPPALAGHPPDSGAVNTRTNPSTRRRRLSVSLVLLAATASLAACGSDDDASPSGASSDSVEDTATEDSATDETTADAATTTTAATATTDTATGSTVDPAGSMDSEFCATAAEAEALGDQVNPAAASGSPEELQTAVEAALEANEATIAIAPPEIADAMARATEFQTEFAELMRSYDWDFQAATSSAEGQELLGDTAEVEADLDEVRAYLEETCGIRDDTDDTTNTDDGTNTGATLPEGDAGLRRFIQLYALGSGNEVTPEQEDCFVQELSGKVEVEQLEAILNDAAGRGHADRRRSRGDLVRHHLPVRRDGHDHGLLTSPPACRGALPRASSSTSRTSAVAVSSPRPRPTPRTAGRDRPAGARTWRPSPRGTRRPAGSRRRPGRSAARR